MQNLTTSRQSDKYSLSTAEKKLQEEKKARASTEQTIASLEKKIKKLDDQNQARAQALANAKSV